MSSAPLIPGVRFDFGGGRVYILPPLSLGSLEVLQDRLQALPTLAALDPEAVKTIIDAAHAALLRNYREITRAEVAELVDVGNMGDVYECLMDVAGLKRRAQQEAAQGNAAAPAVTATPPDTAGAPFTPA